MYLYQGVVDASIIDEDLVVLASARQTRRKNRLNISLDRTFGISSNSNNVSTVKESQVRDENSIIKLQNIFS